MHSTMQRIRNLSGILLIAVCAGGLPSAQATVPLAGSWLAERACPLWVSIKKASNPDGAHLVPGRTYPLLGKNKEVASHYRVLVREAQPAERWVAVECGTPQPSGDERGPPAEAAGKADRSQGSKAAREFPAGDLVLAVSWHPAFCETRRQRPECRSDPGLAPEEVRYFALHGLWPQPRTAVFCGVSREQRAQAERGAWSRLPALDLRPDTRTRLAAVMPGMSSFLHRYQWVKHGRCAKTTPDVYYEQAISLIEQLEASPVHDLFARHLDRFLDVRAIRAAFDQAYGRGAGARVGLTCAAGLIAELRIHLRHSHSGADPALGPWIRAADRRPPGCRGGRVDAPGTAD